MTSSYRYCWKVHLDERLKRGPAGRKGGTESYGIVHLVESLRSELLHLAFFFPTHLFLQIVCCTSCFWVNHWPGSRRRSHCKKYLRGSEKWITTTIHCYQIRFRGSASLIHLLLYFHNRTSACDRAEVHWLQLLRQVVSMSNNEARFSSADVLKRISLVRGHHTYKFPSYFSATFQRQQGSTSESSFEILTVMDGKSRNKGINAE